MKFTNQKINGVYIIEPEPYEDERGMLRRHFCQSEFAKHDLLTDIKQTNISENKKKYTLRGFHYQYYPKGENKVISCVKGHIYDIVVDLRKKSKTYLKWQSFNISDENRISLYVPKGCANAFLTLEDNTRILYYHSEYYSSDSEGGIRFNDPLFKFSWPTEPKIISNKDFNIPDFIDSEIADQ